jgi:glycosyltransferase involved in cell wall biosynthesis
MKISVIIPAFNEAKLLTRTLGNLNGALVAFERLGWSTEVIVCDNNSTDGTAAVARGAGATVVFEPVNQIARARNRGAAAASGDWLVFLDADSCASEGLLADVAAAICAGGCVAGGTLVRMDAPTLAARGAGWIWNGITRITRWMAGAFIFCEAAAFRAVGGFSEEYYAGEELDLSRRLKALACARGLRVVILTRHPLVSSARKLRLYTWREMGRTLWRALVFRRRMWRSREECAFWYDGRR